MHGCAGVHPSDVIQDAMLEAALRLREYAADPQWSFFLWHRMLTAQRLRIVHRHHLGVQARDASREVSLFRAAGSEASTLSMVAELIGRDTRPGEAAVRLERKLRVQQALEAMEPIDRELLALRHFERLTKPEAARVLEISEAAVAQRYFRVLKRLKDVRAAMPGGAEVLRPCAAIPSLAKIRLGAKKGSWGRKWSGASAVRIGPRKTGGETGVMSPNTYRSRSLTSAPGEGLRQSRPSAGGLVAGAGKSFRFSFARRASRRSMAAAAFGNAVGPGRW
jgi:RNA polymerase sigma-70 factor (ECF subfamily)